MDLSKRGRVIVSEIFPSAFHDTAYERGKRMRKRHQQNKLVCIIGLGLRARDGRETGWKAKGWHERGS